MNGNPEPHRRVRRQGPATLRGKNIPQTTTGTALGGSSTPPIPTPPERWTFLPIWAAEPTVAQVSTMVPSST